MNQPPRERLTHKLLTTLEDAVNECVSKYGSKHELATEHDPLVLNLCNAWEAVLSHGLKGNFSLIRNMSDLVSGHCDDTTHWEFIAAHLTTDERNRFSHLQNVWTLKGRVRAFIRAALNEQSIERYILMFLNEGVLIDFYRPEACIFDPITIKLLPKLASALSTILFAVTVDCSEINGSISAGGKVEPIIDAPIVTQSHKKSGGKVRQVTDFDETQRPLPLLASTEPTRGSANLFPGRAVVNGVEETAAVIQNININEPPVVMRTSLIGDVESTTSDLMNSSLQSSAHSSARSSVIIDESNSERSSVSTENEEVVTDSTLEVSMKESEIKRVNSSKSTDTSKTNSSNLTSVSESPKAAEDLNVRLLKARLEETEERCALLEARLTELSLENHRLRMMTNISQRSPNFSISIPHVRLQQGYYAYEIRIMPADISEGWRILRRYREFHKLHKSLQKHNIAIRTLDFPPKKKLGNMNAQFVEQRRQRLQVYLRCLLSVMPEVGNCTTRDELERVFPFFKE